MVPAKPGHFLYRYNFTKIKYMSQAPQGDEIFQSVQAVQNALQLHIGSFKRTNGRSQLLPGGNRQLIQQSLDLRIYRILVVTRMGVVMTVRMGSAVSVGMAMTVVMVMSGSPPSWM